MSKTPPSNVIILEEGPLTQEGIERNEQRTLASGRERNANTASWAGFIANTVVVMGAILVGHSMSQRLEPKPGEAAPGKFSQAVDVFVRLGIAGMALVSAIKASDVVNHIVKSNLDENLERSVERERKHSERILREKQDPATSGQAR